LFEIDHSALLPLLQVILIDVVLAGDNAIVIGMAAARMPPDARRRVIFWGLVFAVLIRVVLATITVELLKIVGLMLAGGILLLWVAWRLWRDLKEQEDEKAAEAKRIAEGGAATPSFEAKLPVSRGAMRRAIARVAIADLSMSLDNVLAVAGAAMNHWWVLTIGLALSIALMGIAANLVARLLGRYPWISYAGLLIVVYVAVRMIWHGAFMVMEDVQGSKDHAQEKRGGVVTLLEPREAAPVRVAVFDSPYLLKHAA